MVAWEALDALSHQLELCKITADTRVVVLLGIDVGTDRTSLIRAAVARTGAPAIEVRMIGDEARPAGADLVAATAAEADIVITTLAHLPEEVARPDLQVLSLPPIAPDTFPPHASLGRRVRKLASLAESATLLGITGATGTDVSIELRGAAIEFDHGVLHTEQPLAQFPAGWVSVVPGAGTVSGDLVLMPGDANRDANRLINSPVLLRIVNDHISAIEGESADADVIRTQLEYAADPSAYGFAELTIGMNPGADAAGPFDDRLLDPIVGRLLAGTIGVSFGANLVADRPCRQQVTFGLRARSVRIDDLPVVVAGQLDGDFAPDVYEL